jgi:hypothetical protein
VRSGREAITRSLLNNVVEDYCRRLVYTWLPKVRRCNGPFDMMSLAMVGRCLKHWTRLGDISKQTTGRYCAFARTTGHR